jgi:hypothetical protein
MGTQILLGLCAVAEAFLVCCLIQFGREWKNLRAIRADGHRAVARTTHGYEAGTVIQIANRRLTPTPYGIQRKAS